MTLPDKSGLTDLVSQAINGPAPVQRVLPYLDICCHRAPPIPLPETPSPYLYLVTHGRLQLFTAAGISEYGAGDYFLSPVNVPLSGYGPDASDAEHLIALCVRFSLADIIAVILDCEGDLPGVDTRRAADVVKADDIHRIVAVLVRMLTLAEKPDGAGFMATHLKRELMYSILMGRFGPALLNGVMNIQNAADIYQTNGWIKKNFRDAFSVQELADKTQMSVSRFHQKFKTAVGMGPLQCQKQLRLSEARRLMLVEALSVTEAGMEVGYESLSQFIREYRRQFGLTPLKDIQQLRGAIKKQPD